ncbi:S53 family peptidase [Kitasatospora sp. McL0602]|uniref:S53 family peptidase n=1 Tax=Kitasatospora sp. McL0602 TaxID=3439530 RepID=UPI003F8ABFFB
MPVPHIRGLLRRATTLAVVTAALAAGAGLPAATAATAGAITPQRVGEAPQPLPSGAVRAADPAGDTPLDLSVSLAPRDAVGAQALAAAVTDPTSAEYHHYLATGVFAQRFGADPATVAEITRALRAAGLAPGSLAADGLTIPVHTTVAAAEKGFGIGIAGYRLADGSTAFRNTAAPALRTDAASAVVAVTGLDTLAAPQAHHQGAHGVRTTPPTKGGPGTAAAAAAYPQLCASIRDEFEYVGALDGRDYYSPSSLAQVYGMGGLTDGGAGSTVAIMSLESYSSDGYQAFQDCYGISSPVEQILVGSGDRAPANDDEVGLEAALDIDTVVGLAPKAKVLFYQGRDASSDGFTYGDLLDTYRRIVTDNRADVVSSSWGECEATIPSSVRAAEATIFLQAALQGQSVYAASGDHGSSSCYNQSSKPDSVRRTQSTDDPSGQPYVTGVGGTTLSGLGSPSEKVWNHDGGASGGGVSRNAVGNAVNYQAGFTGPGFSNTVCGAAAGATCRQDPDVAAVADPDTGYVMATGAEYWMTIGGTSGAAPLWAALTAHVNASHKCSGRVGNVNQPLYQAARSGRSPLTDITSGNNDIGFQGGRFAAAASYDMATGLGTPKGAQLVDALCPPAATYVPVSPQRILDTRDGSGRGRVAAQTSIDLRVGGRAGVPGSGVTAVVLNATVTDTAGAGYLTAYPAATPRPLSSNLNWAPGAVVPNLVTVPVSADGTVALFNGSWGAADFVADIAGYYTTAGAGSQLAPLAPTRLLDTRDHSGRGTVAGRSAVSLQIAGKGGVPASGATAAVLNVTAVDTAAGGWLTAYPSGVDRPLASNLNWVPGQTVPNAVIVPIGADGRIALYNGSGGAMDIVVDIAGYFSPTASGGRFHAVNPTRQTDTRQGHGALANAQTLPVALEAANARVPWEATSAVLNVTVTNTTAPGYLTVWSHGAARPLASNLNWVRGTTVANQVTVPVHNGAIDLAAFGPGTTDVVVDLFGYYSN